MKFFNWQKQYETGLNDVDEQHQYLVTLINQFSRQFSDNKLTKEGFERIFKELAEYAQYHFEEEESLMEDVGIDTRHFTLHVEEHQQFINDVLMMREDIIMDSRKTTRRLLSFLTHWLAYHILGSDKHMAYQINDIQAGVDSKTAYEMHELQSDSATQPLLIALNGLFQLVSSRNRDLTRLNQSLEKKVEERTRELSEANAHLETIALTDTLTGLPNRRCGMHWLKKIWGESTLEGQPMACMMIDADHFKEINDTFGHDAGDIVLCELAKTLQDGIRTDDMVCRLGGDEFLVICPNTDHPGGVHLAGMILDTVSRLRVPAGEGEWKGSVSIGVASRSDEMPGFEALIKRADQGVYAAKRKGKKCVQWV